MTGGSSTVDGFLRGPLDEHAPLSFDGAAVMPSDLMGRYLAAIQRGDRDAAYAYFADDIVGHIPGRSTLAGTVRGRDAVRGYIETVLARTDEHDVELIDMLSGKEHVALVVRERLRSGGRELDMRRANVYRVENDKITEIWIFEGDQYAVDEFLGEL